MLVTAVLGGREGSKLGAHWPANPAPVRETPDSVRDSAQRIRQRVTEEDDACQPLPSKCTHVHIKMFTHNSK